MNCPKCGAVYEDGTKFCPVCGEALVASEQQKKVSYCPKCGQPYEGNPPVCPSCGASLALQNFADSAKNVGQNFANQAHEFGQAVSNGNINQYFPTSQPGMVPSRSIALYIVLTIVTCGIFGLYWLVCIVNDLNTAAGTPDDTNGVVVLLLDIITCGIYGLFWAYKAGDKVAVIKQRRGVPVSGNEGILYLVLQLFGLGIINYCLLQNELNQVSGNQI